MTTKKSASFEMDSMSFYDAQGNLGEYYIYIIQDGEHSGGGVSCYFWFDSPSQLLNSIKKHMDFWEWSEGWEASSERLAEIIDGRRGSLLSDDLLAELDEYVSSNANISLYSWGTFLELKQSDDPFSGEIRSDFRDRRDVDEVTDGDDPSRPITEDEEDDFRLFLMRSPT